MFRIDPINLDESPDHGEGTFLCACGDPDCIGDNEDAGNIRIGRAWYASDCALANHHPEVVRGRELDARNERAK